MSEGHVAAGRQAAGRARGSNWRGEIDGSGLPEELRAVVRRVVGRTGLWASERADVAAELCTHFADGLERGLTPGALREAFGDADAAARLIRRGAMRKRPLAWQAWRVVRTAALVFGLGAASVYLVLLARFVTASPSVSRDFIAELNAPSRDMPDAERAWNAYLAALADLPAGVMSPSSAELIDALADPSSGADAAERARARELVEASARGIESLRRAAGKERMGLRINEPFTAEQRAALERSGLPHMRLDPVPGERPPAVAVSVPSLSVLRQAARLLRADAVLAEEAGDAARLESNWRSMLALARHTRESPLVISHLISAAIDALTFESIGRTLARRPDLLSDRQLRELAHVVGAVPDLPPPASLEGERFAFYDMVQRIYSDDGRGGGRLTPQGLAYFDLLATPNPESWAAPAPGAGQYAIGPALLAVDAGRRRLVAEYDRVMNLAAAEARTPLWLRDPGAVTRNVEALEGDALQRSRFMLISLLVPALDTAAQAGDRHAMQRDALAAAIGLELFRREHGRWPESLGELTPRWMPSVPIDRFVGRPLGYRAPGEGGGVPTLYGVGSNLEDDGGVSPADVDVRPPLRFYPRARLDAWRRQDPEGFAREVPGGDWVLFPPAR